MKERIDEYSRRLSSLRGIDNVTNLAAIEGRLESARLYLESGSVRRFKAALFNGVKKKSSPAYNPLIIDDHTQSCIDAVLDEQGDRLQICIRTFSALENYSDPIWERNQEWKGRIFNILRQYVEPYKLCTIAKSVDDIGIVALNEIILQLKGLKDEIIGKVFHLLLNKFSFLEIATANTKAKNQAAITNCEIDLMRLEDELSDHEQHYAMRKQEMDAKLKAAIEDYESINSKLFSNFVVQEIKSYKLDRFVGKTKNAFASFGGSLLKPETLLKIFEFIGHSRT